MNDIHILSKFTGSIYRCTQAYTNEILKQYGLSCGSCSYLMTLYHNDGINQNQISRELDIDKAMSAREIKKLIRLGYVEKEVDRGDARAYRLHLTERGRSVIPDIRQVLHAWNDAVTRNLDETERKELIRLLDVVLKEARHLRSIQKSDAWL
ncbi:MarR family winged helix-turn-helix transcriptional regulator [Lachnospiraceae bacterium 54-53]